ncbi:hypothetical protein PBI_VANISOA_93 [Mycobacterium phage Vanisoa]|nr:hypothetical protein PBI_VANISOA_93 [Mycobacterium phage Vanisoa]
MLALAGINLVRFVVIARGFESLPAHSKTSLRLDIERSRQMTKTGVPSNSARNVHASKRETVGKDFIAPDLSPVRLVDLELEKGLPGWTDLDVKLGSNAMVDGGREAFLKAEAEAINVGTYVPRPATARREVSRKRPTKRRWS